MSWADRISPAVKAVPPSGIRRFFDIAAEMKGVISLGVGEPDFITPWHIRESCVHGLHKGYTTYTSNYGLLELREEIARTIYTNYNVAYDPRTEVLVTVGVSEALDLAIRALLSPRDEVLIPEPCYVSYKACVMLAGGVPVPVPTTIEHEFRVTVAQLEKLITPRTKALLIGYPNNPTGAIMPKKDLEAIARFAQKHDLIVISDEIYADLTYDGTHTCFASLPEMRDRTILLNGFSKAYAMTGWRIGYALSNPDFIAAMNKIHQYTMLCAPITAQLGAIEALRHGKEKMEKMVAEYNCRRQLMLEGLHSIGLTCFEPKGAFYIFPAIKETGLTSMQFAEELLKAEKVAVVPGDAFGESGEGFIRCSYASSISNLSEALERIRRFVKQHH
ncbi:aminotransferase class I/II-fold pyridoxal phosphate-dependent enzyme [Sporomusa sp.]|uniref:aminotransferase class I/II-fold pyridoxal phosphate-dependent enzyme n=1 Tax=Sporomusa sp. TaxID=2078658 RepID=UPI002C2A6B86|nr:aminotransferase class I/II-fold pyridoxal phosphate-dependent enzyme [Sporomusa sp.]HWR05935.1 aminotransferase class I/II-fold pyridoxal phosphate-dependent enzyme [Sporomusa sp.]